MPTVRSSISIEATPDEVLAFLSDVRNVPRFVGRVTEAEPVAGEAARVVSGDTTQEMAFRVHEGHRPRVEWGVPDGDYHGWLEIDREGQVCSVTAEVHGAAVSDAELDRALWSLKDAVERQSSRSSS